MSQQLFMTIIDAMRSTATSSIGNSSIKSPTHRYYTYARCARRIEISSRTTTNWSVSRMWSV